MSRTIKFDGGIPCNVAYSNLKSHQKDFSRHGDRDTHDMNFKVVSADHINAMETRNYFKARSYLKELDAFADATAWLKDC